MIKVIIFGAATGGKKIASSLLGKEGADMKFSFLWIMMQKNGIKL